MIRQPSQWLQRHMCGHGLTRLLSELTHRAVTAATAGSGLFAFTISALARNGTGEAAQAVRYSNQILIKPP